MNTDNCAFLAAVACVSFMGSILLCFSLNDTVKEYRSKLKLQLEKGDISEKSFANKCWNVNFLCRMAFVLIILTGWTGIFLLGYLLLHQIVSDKIANMKPTMRTFGFDSSSD